MRVPTGLPTIFASLVSDRRRLSPCVCAAHSISSSQSSRSSRPAGPTSLSTRTTRRSVSRSCSRIPARRCCSRRRSCWPDCRRTAGVGRMPRSRCGDLRRSSRRRTREPLRSRSISPTSSTPRVRPDSRRACRSSTGTSRASSRRPTSGSTSAPHDTWLLFHSYAFDFSVWELWGALLHGGRLVVAPLWTTRSPQALADLLVDEAVTVLNATPQPVRQRAGRRSCAPLGISRCD